jgi:hypothetical protein
VTQVRALRIVSILGIVLVAGAAPDWAAFPEYSSQDSTNEFFRSAIVTTDGYFWDFQFAREVNRIATAGYREFAFAFMQCYGGGMIDDLKGLALSPVVYTSASRHDQCAYFTYFDTRGGVEPLFPSYYPVESAYNVHYSPLAGGAPGGRAPQTQMSSSQTGYNLDSTGPNSPIFPLENPQYTTSPVLVAAANAITLHRDNPVRGLVNTQYRAILFGGATQLEASPIESVNPWVVFPGPFGMPGNWRSLNRIHDALRSAGYTNAEVWVLYPGAEAAPPIPIYPGAAVAVPGWVNSGARTKDLRNALAWVRGVTNNQTQVFYWNAPGHGARAFDIIAWLKPQLKRLFRRIAQQFTMSTAFANELAAIYNANASNPNNCPDFTVVSILPADLSITLDGNPLTRLSMSDEFGDGSEFAYRFQLTASDIAHLQSGANHTVVVDYSSSFPDPADFIEFMGPGTGPSATDVAPSSSTPPGLPN